MVVYDLEFHFLNGGMETYQVREGRGDTIQTDAHVVRLELHPTPTLSEDIVIFLAALASHRTVRTEVADEPPPDDQRYTVEAGGSIRVLNDA